MVVHGGDDPPVWPEPINAIFLRAMESQPRLMVRRGTADDALTRAPLHPTIEPSPTPSRSSIASIVRPMQALGGGDLSAEVPYRGKTTEIGVMADALQASVDMNLGTEFPARRLTVVAAATDVGAHIFDFPSPTHLEGAQQ